MSFVTTAHLHAGYNTPGYEPEPFSDRAFLDAETARMFLTTSLLDYVQLSAVVHDCTGVGCADPDCDYVWLVQPASEAIAALWTGDGDEWAHLFGGEVWWIAQCHDGNCPDMPEEAWFRAFLDGVSPEDFDF